MKEDLMPEGLVYKYVRGSHCHGIATEKSDVDTGGVFIANIDNVIGMRDRYVDEVSDERHDTVYFEIGKFVTLLSKSNPAVLESLFVDEEFVVFSDYRFRSLIDCRNEFLTKECFKPFGEYSSSQIRKARGLNKKIVQPIEERKTPMDFCNTFHLQGSMKMSKFLSDRSLKQEYCGLVNIPSMYNCYGVYYDFGNHIVNESISWGDIAGGYKDKNHTAFNFVTFITSVYHIDGIDSLKKWFDGITPIGYRGIVGTDGESTSIRFSSVKMGELPICYLNYNENGYKTHCRKYKEYQEWVAKRNPARYESNLNKNYDAKNMCECARLITVCTEIARGEGFKVNRKGIDDDFLLSIKNHNYEYDELMEIMNGKVDEMNDAISKSTLPDRVDTDFLNDILIDIRKNKKISLYIKTNRNGQRNS